MAESITDTLVSVQTARTVDVLSEGEIEGLVDGDKSIYLDETPIRSADGQLNHAGVTFDTRPGTNSQTHIEGFAAVEANVPVSAEVLQGVDLIRTINTSGLDAVRVNMHTPALFAPFDLRRGTTTGNEILYDISVRVGAGAYSTPINEAMRGMSLAQYSWSRRVELPAGGPPWDIRVRRLNAESPELIAQNKLIWASYDEIVDDKFRYPNSALVALEFDSRQFSRMPARAFDVRGIKVKLPSNRNNDYNSGGYRTYTGDWNGTFVTAWSDNPAWVLYDLITNPRYGLGKFVTAAQIDKWALYRIGRYCDELVPDGFGGTEPRFAINCYIQTRQEAFRVLADLASAFRAMIYWSAGMVGVSQDAPRSPLQQFTPANVVNGLFTYSSTPRRARHTQAYVAWNTDNFDRRGVELVEDAEGIRKYGPNPIDALAFGTTSRGQAARLGRWILVSEQTEDGLVSWRTGLEGSATRVGQLVEVVDPLKGGKRVGGRLRSASTTELELDAPVTLEAGVSYDVSVVLPDRKQIVSRPNNATLIPISAAPSDIEAVSVFADLDGNGSYETPVEVDRYDAGPGELVIVSLGGGGASVNYRVTYPLGLLERAVANGAGTHSTLTLGTALPEAPAADAVWVLSEPNLQPVPYRVLSVAEVEPNVFEIDAARHNPAKFDAIEQGLDLVDVPPSLQPPNTLLIYPPTSLQSTLEVAAAGDSLRIIVTLRWTKPTVGNVARYLVHYRLDNGPWTGPIPTPVQNVQIIDAHPGTYSVEVRAVSTNSGSGNESVALKGTVVVSEEALFNLSRITGLELDGQGAGTEFYGHDARFRWRINALGLAPELGQEPFGGDSGWLPPWVRGYEVRIYSGATLLRRETDVIDARYTYTYDKNLEDCARLFPSDPKPRRAFRIEVAARDSMNRTGPFETFEVSNPVPNGDVFTLEEVFGGFKATGRRPPDPDLGGIVLYASQTNGFTPSLANQVAAGSDFPINVALGGGLWYVRGAYFDDFARDPLTGNVDPALLQISPQVSIDVGGPIDTVDIDPGAIRDYADNFTNPYPDLIPGGGSLHEVVAVTIDIDEPPDGEPNFSVFLTGSFTLETGSVTFRVIRDSGANVVTFRTAPSAESKVTFAVWDLTDPDPGTHEYIVEVVGASGSPYTGDHYIRAEVVKR